MTIQPLFLFFSLIRNEGCPRSEHPCSQLQVRLRERYPGRRRRGDRRREVHQVLMRDTAVRKLHAAKYLQLRDEDQFEAKQAYYLNCDSNRYHKFQYENVKYCLLRYTSCLHTKQRNAYIPSFLFNFDKIELIYHYPARKFPA